MLATADLIDVRRGTANAPRRRYGRPALFVCGTLIALAQVAPSAHAQVSAPYDYVRIATQLEADGYGTSHLDVIDQQEKDSDSFPGESIDALVERFSQFPTTINPALDGFAAARIDMTGDVGVGASALIAPIGGLFAGAEFYSIHTNTGTGSYAIDVGIALPQMEVSLMGLLPFYGLDQHASVMAELSYVVRDASFNITSEGIAASYGLELQKTGPGAGIDSAMSEDLQAVVLEYALNDVELFSQVDIPVLGGVRRLLVDPFVSEWTSPLIEPDGQLILTLLLTAEVSTGFNGAEMGGQARIGDPFNFSNDPLLTLTLADGPGSDPDPDPDPGPDNEVPEPGTLALLAGLAAWGIRRLMRCALSRRLGPAAKPVTTRGMPMTTACVRHAALALALFIAPPAAIAGLIGSQVSITYDNFIFDFSQDAVVGPAIEASAVDPLLRTHGVDVDNPGFRVLFAKDSPAGNFTIGPTTLLLEFSGAEVITGVIFESALGLSSGDVSNIIFDGDSIFIDFGFLALNDPPGLTETWISWVVTTEPFAVPEPDSLTLLGSGFFGLWLLRRSRRQAHAAQIGGIAA